ncbi:gp281 [Bacillus phage G]|uniref:Gp281 n=1 Tax=Bacillus phage G TaxID=2884420 RepID=G3MA22_9CAUD|nr:gp281 [Bacillus phage G]AEO93540.1 gp281 [Bacillus phage G]
MAKLGFLGSSFDPITNGHMITAQEMLDRIGFDKIYLMPSSSKRRDKTMNISDEHRLAMLELAIEDNDKLGIETIELGVPAWEVYTYETMRKLKQKYPNDELYFLMGADLLVDIADGKWNRTEGNWTHVEHLLSENKFVVIRRNGIDMHEIVAKNKVLRKYEKNFEFIYMGVDNNISSSYIRDGFDIGHNPRYYTLPCVYHYIKENNLYVSGK